MAKAGQKRTYYVSEKETDKNATVHGVVVELSPVKTSNKDAKIKYFSGKVSDGNKAGRVICFEPNLRPKDYFADTIIINYYSNIIIARCKIIRIHQTQ